MQGACERALSPQSASLARGRYLAPVEHSRRLDVGLFDDALDDVACDVLLLLLDPAAGRPRRKRPGAPRQNGERLAMRDAAGHRTTSAYLAADYLLPKPVSRAPSWGMSGQWISPLCFPPIRSTIYLNDHLAGATAGVELARRAAGENKWTIRTPVARSLRRDPARQGEFDGDHHRTWPARRPREGRARLDCRECRPPETQRGLRGDSPLGRRLLELEGSLAAIHAANRRFGVLCFARAKPIHSAWKCC